MKLVGSITANVAGIRLNCPKLQLHTGEDSLVASVHLVVSDVKAGLIQMKGIGIFHGEFPGPHHAKSGSAFISEFGLNLVKVHWQLLVAVDFAPKQIGYYLFMGGA